MSLCAWWVACGIGVVVVCTIAHLAAYARRECESIEDRTWLVRERERDAYACELYCRDGRLASLVAGSVESRLAAIVYVWNDTLCAPERWLHDARMVAISVVMSGAASWALCFVQDLSSNLVAVGRARDIAASSSSAYRHRPTVIVDDVVEFVCVSVITNH